MTQKNRPEENPETVETQHDAGADATDQVEGVQEEGANPEGEGNPVEALKAENAELKERTLRTLAEMENLRRRTERELKDAKQYSVAAFARDMLSVSDNLRRALEVIPAEAREGADEGLKSLVQGVEMTEREMLNQLEKHGVKKLDPSGQKFDPNFHQAMFEVPDPSVPANTVVQVVQSGYIIGDRVLRPALVGVSKGGPKEAKPSNGGGERAEPGATVDKTA
ncbi:nucleotide exchange factor GrpE [Rhizobiales bacterium]|uniref:nucleotide exchange factor GrpE n=1 Tax=Hongsoonwoonella zoysiae TaxID=2821844 RepID=UPI001560D9C2|nr:nucleotide exchange factor GrpE [Hongsoonwoonella zoysiae]NRG16467.1 nucleotide exchange factor GrpE [Hongsoonwoonella zoysiae]